MSNNCPDKTWITPLAHKARKCSGINPELYNKYHVKRGLRDINGVGVLAGLTEISEINASVMCEEKRIPSAGRLYYRGYDIEEIINDAWDNDRFCFEEICYLLLFGELPSKETLNTFISNLSQYRTLPSDFTRDMIMKSPGKDMMNMMSRSVLSLYSFDEDPDNSHIENILRQCLQMIAYFPLLAVYGYHAYDHLYNENSLFIHSPQPELSTAENILHMLRLDSKYTKLEARLLDLALVLHAEHGGGNNSTFTTHVVSSTGTDTYSVIAAALGSLKGHRHGGANLKVVQMFEEIKREIKDWKDDDEIEAYLQKLLDKEAFDRTGLIYGMGHAVYSISDPRANIFKQHVGDLAHQKGLDDEFSLYSKIETLAPKIITRSRKIYKGVSANIDFYSGFVYRMLDIPLELFTPIFAISRISGWSAHRIEEIVNSGKIVRPAYKSIAARRKYVKFNDRT